MANPLQNKIDAVDIDIIDSAAAQIRELQPTKEKLLEIVFILSGLQNLKNLIAAPVGSNLDKLLTDIITNTSDIQNEKKDKSLYDFSTVLTDMFTLQRSFKDLPTGLDMAAIESQWGKLSNQIKKVLQYRPDVDSIMDDLQAIKQLKGGPADAVAFHDFNVLQIAFKNIWVHAFDQSLQDAAEKLYDETVKLCDGLNIPVPDLQTQLDVNNFNQFIQEVEHLNQTTTPQMPPQVSNRFSNLVTEQVWKLLSNNQRAFIASQAEIFDNYFNIGFTESSLVEMQKILDSVSMIVKNPEGSGNRLSQLIQEIGKAIAEPYAFDIFAPNSYNFGVMITYRQKWEPLTYQAGDLVATIPLAPNETRKYSKRHVVKVSRAEKEIEKAMSSSSFQSSSTTRGEAEIMKKATTATNFKMTSHGSFNIGIGQIDSTTEFGGNQDQQSTATKKEFHEATVKAAEEYRKERSLEIDTTSVEETEITSSGEISNPNNELTVTYLFYELQRRYRVTEYLYRARPVIMIAQDVPLPHEINEAWLIQYQWIIARVLLDESFRPALGYLTTGLAGDEVSAKILQATWEKQRQLVDKLERQVQSQLDIRDKMRASLIQTTLAKDMMPEMPGGLKLFTMGMDPLDSARDAMDANLKAGETRLKYTEEALADAQDKLRQTTTAFQQATKDYVAAMQNQYGRHIAIDQLRIHVKQNIIFYMQAIWDHEPADQRFFRLYKQKVACPKPKNDSLVNIRLHGSNYFQSQVTVTNMASPKFNPNDQHDLIEMADLDNCLGYKGNYMIFPLKEHCYLTTYMMMDFLDNYSGVNDPGGAPINLNDFDKEWKAAKQNGDTTRQQQLLDYLESINRPGDEIIVPTGQLFIEALPGAHPLLEDFKLLHRFEDVRKVKAEVRHSELENLRLASRLTKGQNNDNLLEDPDIEKKILVEGL